MHKAWQMSKGHSWVCSLWLKFGVTAVTSQARGAALQSSGPCEAVPWLFFFFTRGPALPGLPRVWWARSWCWPPALCAVAAELVPSSAELTLWGLLWAQNYLDFHLGAVIPPQALPELETMSFAWCSRACQVGREPGGSRRPQGFGTEPLPSPCHSLGWFLAVPAPGALPWHCWCWVLGSPGLWHCFPRQTALFPPASLAGLGRILLCSSGWEGTAESCLSQKGLGMRAESSSC